MHVTDRWLIEDTVHGGWAVNDPIEGYIFTILKQHATRFASFEEARQVADRHFNPGRKVRVAIVRDVT